MSLLNAGRFLLNVSGVNSFLQAAARPSSVVSVRNYMRDFWAKPTGAAKWKKKGHLQGKPWIFKNNKGNMTANHLWLKNCGPSRPSYLYYRKTKSFDAMFAHELGRKELMQRIVRGDKKIAEF